MAEAARAFALRRVDTLVVVRALAITLLVLNHSGIAYGLHGGLNVLLLVSGISMATYSFTGSTLQTLRSFLKLALHVAVPAVILAFIFALMKQDVRWTELALISNWITPERVVLFPIWYVQCLVQILLGLSLLFWLFNLTPRIRQAPVRTTALVLAGSVLASVVSSLIWDTYPLRDKLPHLLLWNLTLGWFYWALLVQEARTVERRLLFTAVLLLCQAVVFPLAADLYGDARFVWLTGLGLLLIWWDQLTMPRWLAHLFQLLSQATFFIFLLHHFSMAICIRISWALDIWDIQQRHFVLFLSGLILPVLAWAGYTAAMRSYGRMRQQGLLPAFLQRSV